MLSMKRLAIASLWLAANVISRTVPEPGREDVRWNRISPGVDFQEVLKALPAESLHAVLHEHLHPQFQDGVFDKDSDAVKAVHSENPDLATKLLVAARLKRVRRQAGNTTTTRPPPPPPTTTATTTSPPAVIVTVPITTTNSAGSATVTTATALASASVSVAVPITTTNAQGSTIVTMSTAPAVIVTNSAGQVITSAAPTLSNGVVVMTGTNADGGTYVATITPGGGLISSIVLQTTTLPDGQRSTITSFAVVPAKTSTSSPGPSGQGGPKLQGAASGLRSEFVLPRVVAAMAVVLGAGMVWL